MSFPRACRGRVERFRDERRPSAPTSHLWDELKPVYDSFEGRRLVPNVSITSDGHYQVDKVARRDFSSGAPRRKIGDDFDLGRLWEHIRSE